MKNHLLVKVAHTEPGAAPPQARDFDAVYQSNKATFTLVAPANTPLGTVGYVKACYITFSGKQGPESEVFQFVINISHSAERLWQTGAVPRPCLFDLPGGFGIIPSLK